jgi:ATP-binding cassette subfamily F protein 3
MLRIDNITCRAGPRLLIDGASASIDTGHRVGLVGRNGSGKTTLLRMIIGQTKPDGGSIAVPSRWRIGLTRQEAPEGDGSLIETVLAADSELAALHTEAETATDPDRIAAIHARLQDRQAHAAPARAARILAGLGFDDAAQQRPCSDFSGGWRMRVALAALLFTEPDLLLLDEPTNHLDLEASLWLEDWLRRYPRTLLLVSHDRGLLNRVATSILHLEGQALTLYQGGYDRFEATRRARLEQDAKRRVKIEAQRAHLQKFVDRFRYQASKAKQAQSRLKMLSRLEPVPERGDDGGTVAFDFPAPDALPPPLYSLRDVSIGYGGPPVLRGVSLRLDSDDRVALLGANGNGKSTLIKLLAGRLEADSGDVVRPPKLRVGYFAQHQTDELDLDATPTVALSRRRPADPPAALRAHLGHFGLSQERSITRIGDLSGGEKARLLLALMSCDKPHILLLDEPTNHLDVESRQALIEALAAYNGAVVIVSHDPHILELTADRLWLVADGTVTPYDGDLGDYRSMVLGQPAPRAAAEAPAAKHADRKAARRDAAAKRRTLAPLRQALKKAERAVETLTAEKTALTARLAEPALYSGNPEKLVALQKTLGETEKALADAEADWLSLQDAFDAANNAEAEAS